MKCANCPVCNRELNVSENQASIHVERCLRRSKSINFRDEIEDEPDVPRLKRNRNAKDRKNGYNSVRDDILTPVTDIVQSNSVEDDQFLEFDDVELEIDDNAVIESVEPDPIVCDDWDDDLFKLRIQEYDVSIMNNNTEELVLENPVDKIANSICPDTWNNMFAYQRDGVRWLHALYEKGAGGILGDEMGLGIYIVMYKIVCEIIFIMIRQNCSSLCTLRNNCQ